ncbi:hypothetical protein HY045_01315, partial [Candidatus Woesebacteria bacterium]|nr:hypothetical protein [Candidatus Woesebacteria bacterium]
NLGFICDASCRTEIKKAVQDEISKSTPKSTVATTTIPKPTVAPIVSKQTSYIPFAGPITSTSTDWVDATGTDITIDVVNDYGKNAAVSWQTSLKVADGNGQAYARLFDVTHGIAVSGSEISTTNNSDYQTVSSGNFTLWSGRNTYRVQIKSLNSFVVTFGSGRMKIVY